MPIETKINMKNDTWKLWTAGLLLLFGVLCYAVQAQSECPAPPLSVKDLPPNDGTKAFFWVNPPCGKFYLRATSHPDPENAPDTSFETLQPTLSTRQVTQSSVRVGMLLLSPVTQSVIVPASAPWTGVELFTFAP